MKYSLASLSVACFLSSALGNLCDFSLDADTLQTSVFDSHTPALIAFTRDEDHADTVQLMEGSVASLGELGFCVATFDCSEPKHSKLCSITAGNFPFLSLYLGEPKKNPYTKKNYREHTPYLPHDNTKETNRKIDKFISKALGADRIAIADSESTATPLLTNEALSSAPQVLLLSSKTQSSLLWRRVAFHFQGRLQFAQIKADAEWTAESDLLQRTLGAVAVPSVLVRSQDQETGATAQYPGDLKSYQDIVEWLAPHALPAPPPSSSGEKEENKEGGGESSKAKGSTAKVNTITASEFAALLSDTTREEDVHVIAVRPSDAAELDLTPLLKKCYGALSCAEFICPPPPPTSGEEQLDETVARFCPPPPLSPGSAGSIPSEPYLLVVPYMPADRAKLLAAPSKSILKSSEGGVFSPEVQASAAKRAQESFPESLAVPIDESQLQNFLGACVQGQVFGMLVLASAGKTSPPAMLRHVAAAHKDMVKIAYVSDPSPKFLQQFGIPDATFPSALALVQPLVGDQFQVMYYDKEHFGAMNFRSLTSFVYNVIEGAPGMKEQYMKKMQAKQAGAPPPQDSVPSAPAVLTHITSQEQWQEQCGAAFKGICAVGFIGAPDLATGEYSASSVAIFESLMNSLSHHMKASFHFVWMDIACQSGLAGSFDLTADTSPGLVMYSPLKQRYATYVGNFKQESLTVFASSMLNSKIRTFPIRGDDVVYDDSVNCLVGSEGSGRVQESAEESAEMEDFLAEIKAEEEERAEELRRELAAEKQQKEEEKARQEAEKKKKKKKKSKKKKAKKEL